MSGSPKRHHYLPRFYLDGFAKDGRIWVYDRETNKLRQDTAVNTGVISRYYEFEDDSGERRSDIEGLFAPIEGTANTVIQKLAQRDAITDEEKILLSLFAGFQLTRVPRFERGLQEGTEGMMKRVSEMAFGTVERTQAALEMTEAPGHEDPETAKKLMDFVKRGEYSIELDRNYGLRMMLELGREMTKYFVQMDWLILHAPGNKSFITTDVPFWIDRPPDYPQFLGIGITTTGAVKYLPLNSGMALAMLDQGDLTRHVEISAAQVRALNLGITARCERLVIGRDQRLVRSLVDATTIAGTKPGPAVEVG